VIVRILEKLFHFHVHDNENEKDAQELGDLKGSFSLRLNLRDRVVYSFDKDKEEIHIKRCKTHYGS
jgi:Txe/YoeB family toxin of Txe-Axe toxin-antitoxin module